VLGLAACSLNSAGNGSGSGAMPVDDGVEDEAEGTVTGDEGTTTADGEGTVTSGATNPGDGPADGPMMDDGPAGHPAVTISNDPMFDFGPRNLTESADQAFTVTNEGDGDATAVQVAGVGGAFSVLSHDCPPTLAAGDACEVQVRFDPALFGDVQTELQIAYQDQGTATMESRQIVGRGIGVTGNLLVNGGGELGNSNDVPPMGWNIGYGPSWSANWFEKGLTPVEGSRTISAGWGPPDVNGFTLHQQIDVAALTAWGDAAGVRVYYRAFHRSETEGNDPTWVELRFHDAGGGELALHPSSLYSSITWNESVGNFVAPPSARTVQLSLQCNRVANDWCSGFFDGLEVWAEWLG
jgi:hypothetical protein